MMSEPSSFFDTRLALFAKGIESKFVCSFWRVYDINIKANEVIWTDCSFDTVCFDDSNLIGEKS